jgi:hypothetical protein
MQAGESRFHFWAQQALKDMKMLEAITLLGKHKLIKKITGMNMPYRIDPNLERNLGRSGIIIR